MSNYDNTNSGILTANESRRNDKDPTHQGSINIEGKEFWLSAWVNTGKDGGKLAGKRYFSIKAKPKEARNESAPKREQVPGNRDDDGMSDEIPF